MLTEFFQKNSRSLLIIIVLIGLWLILYFFNSDHTKDYLLNPKKGQVYIFKEDNFYAPMRLDSVSSKQLFLRNYAYLFADAIPERNQILSEEFDLNFIAIYEKTEIQRLFEAGSLVKIYP